MKIFKDAEVYRVGANVSAYAEEKEERGSPKLTMRAHTLGEILRNPRRWRNGYESPQGRSQQYGELLDCLALSPMQWPRRFCVTPAEYERDGERKKWRNDRRIPEIAKWWQDHEGLTVVDDDLNGKVHAALKVLQSDVKASDLLKSGVTQVWVRAIYCDKATGLEVPVKCLIDLVPIVDHPLFGDYLVDLKTTVSAHPARFARDVFNYGYDLQAAWYLDLYNCATHENRTDFCHIVQENFPPYELRIPMLGRPFVDRGRLRYQAALELYSRCVCSGRWPGYDSIDTQWPITEPEPWMLSFDNVYPIGFGEQNGQDQEPEEEKVDVAP